MEITVWAVALAALITAVATGLGALPFLFFENISRRWLGISNALAAGLMLGASIGLIAESIDYSILRSGLGVVLGFIFIIVVQKILEGQEELEIGALEGADALKALMIVGIMTLHSFTEGVGVGVSFGGGRTLGQLITVAIAVHNIPEGLAISLVLIPRGTSVWKASLWSVFSSLPQPLMAIPAFLFVSIFRPVLPVGLGFAAGAMVWMVFAELWPDAIEDISHRLAILVICLSLVLMILFQLVVG